MRISLGLVFLLATSASAAEPALQSSTEQPAVRKTDETPQQRLGFGIGSGLAQGTDNAGALYKTSAPMIDARLIYWPVENVAFLFGFQDAKHQYDVQPDGPTDVDFQRLLLQARYQLGSGKLTPQLIGGIGRYTRKDTVLSENLTYELGATSAFGFNAGFGFQYSLILGKAFFQVEGVAHFVSYDDNLDGKFQASGIANRNGAMLTGTASFVWAFL